MKKSAALACALLPLMATATVVMKLSIEEHVQLAAVVVRGTVIRSEASWDAERARIWTYTEVNVSAALKGQQRGPVLVRQPGGVVGEVGQDVSGAARFTAGEEVVLFLYPTPDEPGVFGVEGLASGKVSIRRRLGVPMAVRQLSGLAFATKGLEGKVEVLGTEEVLGTADAFWARVKRAAEVR